jgi:hypothetical protein
VLHRWKLPILVFFPLRPSHPGEIEELGRIFKNGKAEDRIKAHTLLLELKDSGSERAAEILEEEAKILEEYEKEKSSRADAA